MNGFRHCFFVVTAASALTACGGGGGGSNPPATQLATITSANAPVMAGAVVTAALEGGDLAAFADFSPATGSIGTPKTRAPLAKVTAAHIASAQTLLKDSQIGLLQTPIGPVTENCQGSGSFTLSGELADEQTLTAGDTINFTFASCDDGVTVIDGSFAMTITSFSGDFVGGSFSFGVSVEVGSLTVSEGGETATLDGDVSVTIDATSSPSLTLTTTSSSLSVAAGGTSHTLSNYTSTQTIDTVAGTYSLTTSGSLASSAFTGRVDFETTATLMGTGEAYAGTGEIVITGAENATITVTVLDSSTLLLQIDTDGDGLAEEEINSTWAELT